VLDPLPNVHFLGFQPVEVIPGYCKGFDVCMIPYMLNDFTRSIMPLKIVEYLATGKPVVSTPLPAAVELNDVIRVGDTADQWERHIEEALDEGDEARQLRISRAAEYDWDVLVQRRLQAVAGYLQERKSRHRPSRPNRT
jgi:glycosyltransferase involved in cell wall biosynthesis